MPVRATAGTARSTNPPAPRVYLPDSAFKQEAIPVWITIFGLCLIGYSIIKK